MTSPPTSSTRTTPSSRSTTSGHRRPTHLLIIPRDHIATLNDLGPQHRDMIGDMHLLARELARAEGLDEAGWRLVMNCGAAAGQTVFHIHLHLLGGRTLGWPPG